jgi:hypothetical protein
MGPISDENSILSGIPIVQTHSDDGICRRLTMLATKKLRYTGEGRCPSRNWIPAFAGKAEERDAALYHPNACER